MNETGEARKRGGRRRSSRLAFRRRLLLLRLLLRYARTKEELIAAVQEELGTDGYPMAAESALKHDLDTLKTEYDCRIRYHAQIQCYVLEDLGYMALLDIPEDCLETLAFLEVSFSHGSDLPEYTNIRLLLERVMLMLSPNRRQEYERRNTIVKQQLVGTVPTQINADVLLKIRRAISKRQEVEFDYLSTFDRDTPRRHRVAPYAIFFRPEGHGYLDATLLDVKPRLRETIHAPISYRLNRIIPGSVKILPNMLPPERISPRRYRLRYWLAPVVARRRDMAIYFPNTHITFHQDESATVTATITNLWQARQILLRYGTACQVLEPPELRELFRETAKGLSEIYC